MWRCPGSSATYGVFQAGHVVFNVVCLSGLRPIPEFPWPPAEGWHPQATAFWTATGLIDTAIALLALYFVAAFFGGRCRALWAGLVSLATLNDFGALRPDERWWRGSDNGPFR